MPPAAKPEPAQELVIDFTPSREQYIRMLNLILRKSDNQEDRIFAYNELEQLFKITMFSMLEIHPGREF